MKKLLYYLNKKEKCLRNFPHYMVHNNAIKIK